MTREFSPAALEWLANYHGSIDATALLLAYEAGHSRGFDAGFEHGYQPGSVSA